MFYADVQWPDGSMSRHTSWATWNRARQTARRAVKNETEVDWDQGELNKFAPGQWSYRQQGEDAYGREYIIRQDSGMHVECTCGYLETIQKYEYRSDTIH